MAERIRAFDWSKTPLGPVQTWSSVMQMMVRFLLANRFPLLLWWGPQYVSIYNDAYIPVLGTKHPWALGQPVSECWKEIWHILRPLIDTPFNGGSATWNDDILLEINRHGFVEETHFTIAYSPVPDETVPSGIGGVLATVHEITGKVVGDRRVGVLRDLGAGPAKAKTAEEACALAAATLASCSKDIPFALLYLIQPDRKTARLAGMAGVAPGERAGTTRISLESGEAGDSPWPLGQAMRSEATETLTALSSRLIGQVPPGPWSDPPDTAVVVPIHSNKAGYLAGFLVAGVSSRLQLDDSYRDFLNLVSMQIATSIANAREYEEEKKRAEALAEIDQAKTAFFSNVSHEFRTPLTLMLGPIEDLLSRSHTELAPAARNQLEVTHRNSLRLLRLVNTLLDFSRIEAGRMQAAFEAADLGAFTTELASVFRAATERAGLRLRVECPTLSERVYVDREMWEKIVLNLVSNAFKFTFEGEIAVTLRVADQAAELRVSDTGVGIPAGEIPRLFERFHRAPNTRSRTHEGSGIGLALVQELVKLHGGSVRVESRPGEGSTFIVSVPLGKAHLPPEHVGSPRSLASTSVSAAPFVQEAMRWLPDDTWAEPLPNRKLRVAQGSASETRANLLVADDNTDMRQYLARILSERYQVQTVPDGEAALAAAREHRPDLILSDIMMPRLDGIGLLRELRTDVDLRTVPVILLSARAGEESRLEGLQVGANDYLIKPFSARELLARVAAHLDLARLRKQSEEAIRESEERLRFIADRAHIGYWHWEIGADRLEWSGLCKQLFGIPPEEPMTYARFLAALQPEDRARTDRAVRVCLESAGHADYDIEYRTLWPNGTVRWIHAKGNAVFADGKPVRMAGIALDITEHKEAEEALRESEERFRALVMASSDAVYRLNRDWTEMRLLVDREFIKDTQEPSRNWLTRYIHPKDQSRVMEAIDDAIRTKSVFELEHEVVRLDGSPGWTRSRAVPILDSDGEIVEWFGTASDITARRLAEERLRQTQKLEGIGLLAGGIAHDFNNLLIGVIGNASLIQEMIPPRHQASQQVEAIIKTGQQLAHLTRQMLAYSGKGRFFIEHLDLSAVARDVGDLVRPTIRKRVVLQFELEESLPGIEADRGQVQQVLMNLVINAAEAIGSHDGVVTVATGTRVVDGTFPRLNPGVFDLRHGEYVALEVRDTGCGMDESVRVRIFEPFFSTKFTGRGLGLAAVHGIVRGHQGAIFVTSEPGKGSTFTILFPAAGRKREQNRPAAARKAARGSGTVLVIDDEKIVRVMAKGALERNGYNVLIAHDGPSAIDIFRRHPGNIDLAILDLSMPGMSGEETLPELRKIRPDVKVLVSSGYSEAETMAMFRGQKVSGFVQKPYTAGVLAEKVKNATASTGDAQADHA